MSKVDHPPLAARSSVAGRLGVPSINKRKCRRPRQGNPEAAVFLWPFLGVNIRAYSARHSRIPLSERAQWILQERLNFEPVIETPHGATKAEVRIMYIWNEELLPVLVIMRLGRGAMMGVDHNKNMEWVGSSCSSLPSRLNPALE